MDSFNIIAWIVDVLGLPPSWGREDVHVTTATCVFAAITVASLLAWRRLRKTSRRLVPEDRATFANLFEVLVEGLLRMMQDAIGPNARKHLPLIGSLFIYILACNLIGVIPGMLPPTENINTNLACAIVVFVYYNVVGIREQGLVRYLKHMSGPIIWLAPLLFSIELVSNLVRPVSLSVRLFGNIVGDHVVNQIFLHLTPIVVPMVFQALAIFVAFIQAFVFTLLSVVYISLAEAHEGH